MAVLLHGRGSHRGDLQALHDRLPEEMVLVTPQAPHPGHPWGYGPGWAWYRHLESDHLDRDTLETSLDGLHHFLTRLPGLVPVRPGPLFLGGFSQGGTTSLAYALREPARLAGVLNFSGFLPRGDLVDLEHAGATPIFWGHGRRDANVAHALAKRGRERLSDAGARLRSEDYDIGHWIDPDELSDAVEWMGEIVSNG